MLDFEDGVHLIGTEIHLDARRARERAVVTHAHHDHVGRHRRFVTSPGTAALCRRRWPGCEIEPHEFHQSWDEDGARLTLLPAGHILGSSMVLLERAGTRVLYSGDFRLRASATAEACAPARADVLVMECTFGDPRFRFPERLEVLDRVCEFVSACLDGRVTPVLLAYSLGKAQEAAWLLGERGFPVALAAEAWSMLDVYRDFGIEFHGCEPLHDELSPRGAVLLPPGPDIRERIGRFPRSRLAFLSGWALDPWRRPRGCDAAFALSDHADFEELIELVRRVAPRKAYTLHGPDSFATLLRARGIDAEPASAALQGSLF